VLKGQIGAWVGDQEVTAGPGCYLLKPRRVPHTFWNPGPRPARVLEIISPAGFEQFFEQAPTVSSQQKEETLASRYGLGLVLEWPLEDLKARYNRKLLGE
jgi:Cupin domain